MTAPTSRVSGYDEMATAALLLYGGAVIKASGHSAAELQAMPKRKAERALNTAYARRAQPLIQRFKQRQGTETGLLALSALYQLTRDHLGADWVRQAAGHAITHLDALPRLPDIRSTP